LASGALTPANQSLIVNAITSISATTETGLLNRIYAAVLMVMSSTDYLIQR
jgi:ethanolamine utilization microcompartment shell protein EutS